MIQEDSAPSEEPRNPVPPASRPSKPTRAIPSSRIRFDSQLKVLRGWAVAGRTHANPTNENVADVCGINASTISGNNAFFTEAGLLTKEGGGYRPTEETLSFGRALSFNAPDAARKLAPAFREAWFWTALSPRLEFGPLTRADALDRLAEAAGASGEHENALRSIVDWLAEAGMIRQDDDRIYLVRSDLLDGTEPPEQQAPPSEQQIAPPVGAPPPSSGAPTDSHSIELRSGGNITLTVSVNLFALDSADRTFVLDLIDKVKEYERPKAALMAPGSPTANGADED